MINLQFEKIALIIDWLGIVPADHDRATAALAIDHDNPVLVRRISRAATGQHRREPNPACEYAVIFSSLETAQHGDPTNPAVMIADTLTTGLTWNDVTRWAVDLWDEPSHRPAMDDVLRAWLDNDWDGEVEYGIPLWVHTPDGVIHVFTRTRTDTDHDWEHLEATPEDGSNQWPAVSLDIDQRLAGIDALEYARTDRQVHADQYPDDTGRQAHTAVTALTTSLGYDDFADVWTQYPTRSQAAALDLAATTLRHLAWGFGEGHAGPTHTWGERRPRTA